MDRFVGSRRCSMAVCARLARLVAPVCNEIAGTLKKNATQMPAMVVRLTGGFGQAHPNSAAAGAHAAAARAIPIRLLRTAKTTHELVTNNTKR